MVAADCPGSRTLAFDTTDLAGLPGIVVDAGPVAILVNNAGISQRSLALDTSFGVYRTVMEVDFFAPLRLMQLVLPAMVAARARAVVNLASVAGKFGSPMRTGCRAAKHAMIGWSDALRAEIAQYGVAVHVVTRASSGPVLRSMRSRATARRGGGATPRSTRASRPRLPPRRSFLASPPARAKSRSAAGRKWG